MESHFFTHPNQSLGELLVSFFHYFGNEFDYCSKGISVRNGPLLFSKKERGWLNSNRPFLLSLEDPTNSNNDVGKKSFEIRSIVQAFREAYEDLTGQSVIYHQLLHSHYNHNHKNKNKDNHTPNYKKDSCIVSLLARIISSDPHLHIPRYRLEKTKRKQKKKAIGADPRPEFQGRKEKNLRSRANSIKKYNATTVHSNTSKKIENKKRKRRKDNREWRKQNKKEWRKEKRQKTEFHEESILFH